MISFPRFIMKKKEFLIIVLPITIIIYSILIFVFLFDKKIEFVMPATSIFEIIIPVMLGLILAMQFSLYGRAMKRRRKEIEELKNQLSKYKSKVKKLKINEEKIKKELDNQLNFKDYNYSIIKLSFLIENELQRLLKKKKVDGEKLISIRAMSDYLSKVRNKAVHGVKMSRSGMIDYVKVGEILLNILRSIK
ncbi:hypothetical protein HYX07_00280 [Candidatus Woesearchaeota archaeon]|nr:hypothetical protein [Candidatus Woesearchaeota archaeon]